MNLEDDFLKIEFKDNKLNISIGYTTLIGAVLQGPVISELIYSNLLEGKSVEINNKKFLESIIKSLQEEDEEGLNLIHKMFDKASLNVIESGYEGFEIKDKEKE